MFNKMKLLVVAVLLILTSFFALKLLEVKKDSIKILDIRPLIISQDQHGFTPPLPSINSIFSDDHNWIATLSAQRVRTLAATGDIIPARSINFGVARHKSPLWPYLKVADTFHTKKSDLVFINLETPLINDCPLTDSGMIFCGDRTNIEGLKYIGVSVASLANNHAGNYGTKGVLETANLLNKNGILATGIDGAVIKNIKGVKFAFLGYNDITKPQPGISNVDEQNLKNQIADAKQKADIIVVTFHWGVEYTNQPDDRQRYLGHLAIDAGADLIIGNHPHWIQPVELYKGKLITYAHGNFVFDQMWSEKTREGVVGWYTFYDYELIDVQFLPVQIDDYGQPHFLEGSKKEEVLTGMKNESINILKGESEKK